MKKKYILGLIFSAVAATVLMFFSGAALAGTSSNFLGKNLAQNRDLLASAMRGRSYVVQVDQHGKITQVVDTGATNDIEAAQQLANKAASVKASTQPTPKTALVAPVAVPENFQGQTALDYMGLDLPVIAASYGLTPDKLQETFLNDSRIRIDRTNRIFYVDSSTE